MVQPQGERQPDSFRVSAVILFYVGAALVVSVCVPTRRPAH